MKMVELFMLYNGTNMYVSAKSVVINKKDTAKHTKRLYDYSQRHTQASFCDQENAL